MTHAEESRRNDGRVGVRNPPRPLGAIIPGFLSFGFAAIRGAPVPRSVAILLFLPAVIFLIDLTSIAVLATVGSGPVAWGAMVLASAQTIVLLAIGILLRRAHLEQAHAYLASG